MKMKKRSVRTIVLFFLALGAFCFTSCSSPTVEEEAQQEPKTPVTLGKAGIENISEVAELRATSLFQKKVSVKSTLAGYIESMSVNIGDEVAEGQVVFVIKTKEANALASLNMKDTALNFSGLIKIKAQKSGIITTLDHQKGDYVLEGDQLGIISERSSLVFILEVPFELHSRLKTGASCDIVLPDDEVITGKITGSLPSVDAASQTQSFVIAPAGGMKLPENLIAKVRIIRQEKQNAVVLPKLAVLADEAQTEFWVMKLINDSTAIKVPVKKGIETSEKVEIISPVFSSSDRIIIKGNYGLADTAGVTIQPTE
jgi:multidrug efflux pump subunit AcrA (membrane-fusion protein)